MSAVPIPPPASPLTSSSQLGFLAILPRIRRHGRVAFRRLRCPAKKEDAIAEMVALAWKWCLRLAERGKDVRQFPSALATYAARAVHAGRRLCRMESGQDALSPLAQRRRGFVAAKLPDVGTLSGNPLSDALADNTVTPPDEQCAFRIDFPDWLRTRTKRDRRVIEDLMCGERTTDVSNKYGLSPGRVSQLRRQFLRDWERFCEPPASAEPRGRRTSLLAHSDRPGQLSRRPVRPSPAPT
jgi:hypothetical protein